MPNKQKIKKNKSYRISDLDDAIFKPDDELNIEGENVDRNFMQNIDKDITIYTLFGKHDDFSNEYPVLLDEDNEGDAEKSKFAFAKKIVVNGENTYYYVKRGMRGELLNPLDLTEGEYNKLLKHTSKKTYEFHKVNHRIFQFYIDFLRTKNKAFLHHANREII